MTFLFLLRNWSIIYSWGQPVKFDLGVSTHFSTVVMARIFPQQIQGFLTQFISPIEPRDNQYKQSNVLENSILIGREESQGTILIDFSRGCDRSSVKAVLCEAWVITNCWCQDRNEIRRGVKTLWPEECVNFAMVNLYPLVMRDRLMRACC